MTTSTAFALMAGVSYRSTRHENNRLPVPDGWTEVPLSHVNLPSGFEAVTFRNNATGELAISFAGTSNLRDWTANFGLGTGFGADQLRDAADYYMTILTSHGGSNPNAAITFTGHSLGGGLAALMGVFFNKKAVTFDQAPFANSATTAIRDDLVNYLATHGYSSNLNTLAPALAGFTGVAQRAGNVTGINVEGEILSSKMVEFFLSRIGAQSLLTHGDYFAPIDLHSQALLTTFVQNDGFRKVTFTLTDLLPMVFDSQLFYYDPNNKDNPQRNFLENLLRHEVGGVDSIPEGGDKMLARFTADLQKLAATSGLSISGSDLTKALIAFAMQAYYEGRIATDVSKQLFEAIGGGLHFERSDISNDPDLNKIKGYVQYFQDHLATLPPTEQALINQQLPNLLDWYLAGTRLNATAQDKSAFMLGAGKTDNLTGGTRGDLLVGMAGGDLLSGRGGADTLIGSTGSDFLFGGEGQDRYVFDTGDGENILADWSGDGRGGDGQGKIEIDGQELTGSFTLKSGSRTQWQKDGWTASFVGEPGERGLLVLTRDGGSDKLVIPNYLNGELGISLEAPSDIVYTDRMGSDQDDNTLLNDTHPHENSLETAAANQKAFGLAGADLIELKHADTIGYGGANNDVIRDSNGSQELRGEDGNDLLIASTGDDSLFGDIGNDVLQGGADNDRLNGGDGMDFIDGGQGSDYILGGIGDDFILGGGNLTLELSAVGSQYNDFADGEIAMLTKNASGQFVLPDLAGISPTNARAYEAEGWVNVEGDGADYIDAGDGDDLVLAGDGTDVIKGGVGKDTLIGQAGGDWIEGGTEDDILLGDGRPSDVVLVESGNPLPVTTLPASHGDDYLDGGAGNDYLRGDGGSDILVGGADDDTLTGDAEGLDVAFHGNDMLDGGTGNDLLYGYGGSDTLLGGGDDDHLEGDSSTIPLSAHGDDYLDGGAGNDVLIGSGGNDILIGGSGIDVLAGGSGKDTYIFNKGDGVDIVADDDKGADASVFIFGAGFDPAAIELGKGSLLLNLGDGDAIHVENFDPNDPLANPSIEEFRFADGTSLSWDQLLARGFDLRGTAGDDDIIGTALTDRFYGGTGSDTLTGGAGDDTYFFNLGDGADTVIDAEGINEIVLGAGLDASALVVNQSMSLDGKRYLDLDFGNGDIISIQDGENGGIASLRFADGSVLMHAELLQRLPYLDRSGTNAADTLIGTVGEDSLIGLGGADTLIGNAGADLLDGGADNDLLQGGEADDILDGGSGNDTLQGGMGTDAYRLTLDMGHDTADEAAGETSILELEEGVALATLTHARVGDDLVIRFQNGAGSLTLANHYQGERDWQVKLQDGSLQPLANFLAALDAGPATLDEALAEYKTDVVAAWQASWYGPEDRISSDGSLTHRYPGYQGDSIYRYQTVFDVQSSTGGTYGEALTITETSVESTVPQHYINASGKFRYSIGSSSENYKPHFVPRGSMEGRSGAAGSSETLYARNGNGEVIGTWHYLPYTTEPVTENTPRVDTTYTNTAHVPVVTGDDADNFINIEGRGIADGGVGNDVLSATSLDDHIDWSSTRDLPGALLYGNDGEDGLFGGADDDVLIGGRGRDNLYGGDGADTYRVLEEDSVDWIDDAGSDFARYKNAYYHGLGIQDIPFHEQYGGQWFVSYDGGGMGFGTYEEAIADMSARGWPTSPEQMLANGWMKYVEPLPELPAIAGNDYAAIEALVARGVVRPDRVVFGPGVTAENLIVSGSEAYGSLRFAAPDGSGVEIGLPNEASPVGYGIEQVEFADGSRLTMRELLERVNADHDLAGTDGDESLVTAAGNDSLQGLAGMDYLDGGAGDDLLDGGADADSMDGSAGADTIVYRLGDGADWIADSGNDLLAYAQAQGIADAELRVRYGNRWVVDNNGWHAFETREEAEQFIDDHCMVRQNDRATGLTALETAGRLRYVEAYEPSVAANDFAAVDALVAAGAIRPDRIVFGEGITPANVQVNGNPDYGSLYLTMPDGAQVQVGVATAADPLGTGIEQLVFADGTTMGVGGAVALANADHVLVGSEDADWMTTGAGNDTLDYLGGDDSLDGGRGNDLLKGGTGSDSYMFERGYGQDTIVETTAGADTNSLWLGFNSEAVSPDALGYARSGNDLVVTIAGWTGDAIKITGWFDAATPVRLQTIWFPVWDDMAGNWTSMDAAAIEAAVEAAIPTVSEPPTVTASNRTLLLGTAVAASDLIQTTGNVQNYQFWDDVNGGGRFLLDGVAQVAGASITISADRIADLQYIAGDATATERLWARVTDGSTWSAWTPWNITSAPHLTNDAPIANADNLTIGLGDAVAVSGMFSVTDADDDVPTKYEFWDDGASGGRFVLDGVDQAASASIAVAADQLANLQYVGDSAIGTERVWVRAFDGQAWSAWKSWNITSAPHPTNEAPVVSATDSTVGLNAPVAAGTLFSVVDVDGDVSTKYEFWDDGQGGGRFVLNGVDQAAGTSIAVTADQLAGLQYVGAGAMGSERVWARAWDGQAWSAWKSWNMLSSNHATNTAPVASAANATMLLGESAAASSLFTASDADGDPVVKYEFWDDVNGGGHFAKGGIEQAASASIAVTAAELSEVSYVAGSQTGSERVWVRASDGVAWGSWTPWNITSAAHLTNAAPSITAPTGIAGLGQAVAAASLFSVADPDGDVPTKYEFWDDTNGGGYFAKNGIAQAAGASIAVTAAELPSLNYVGGNAMASERVWVRAYDGQTWSGWAAWNMQSSNHASNVAPTITAANRGILAGDPLAASSLFTATDSDGDVAVKYEFWDDINGGGHFAKAGVQQAAGTSIAVSAADLSNLSYVGGNAAATERVWVRANDGLAWSGWKAWNMTTVTGMQRGGPGGDSLIANGEILMGNEGNDSLAGPTGNNLLFGGAGDDTLSSGPGNSFLAGGTGNDNLQTGSGNDVIAFNTGDGADAIYLNGGSDTISLGGGIRYEDLALHQEGNDLVLDTGNGESLTFKDWYTDISHQSALNLQLIAETMADFDANGSDTLHEDKVEAFDFGMLVERFEQARAANAAITQWNLMNDLMDAHLFGSDDAALGGDLSYQYGRYGNFANVGLTGAQNVLNGSQFAIGPQTFQSLQGLQEGVARLG